MWAPGRATTSKVGLGMNSVIGSRTTSFLRPLISTKRNRLGVRRREVAGEARPRSRRGGCRRRRRRSRGRLPWRPSEDRVATASRRTVVALSLRIGARRYSPRRGPRAQRGAAASSSPRSPSLLAKASLARAGAAPSRARAAFDPALWRDAARHRCGDDGGARGAPAAGGRRCSTSRSSPSRSAGRRPRHRSSRRRWRPGCSPRPVRGAGRRARRRRPRPGCWRASRSSPSPSARRAPGWPSWCPAGAVCDAVVVLDGDRLRARAGAPTATGGRSPTWPPRRWPTSTWPRARRRRARRRADGRGALRGGARRVAGAHRRRAGRHRRRRPRARAAPTPPSGGRSAPPIGTFQGVAHPLADDATRLDGARLLVRKAAWASTAATARAASWPPWPSPSRPSAAEARHLRRPPRPRGLRVHARVRRAAATTAGPGAGRGSGATPRPATGGRRGPLRRVPTRRRLADGLRLGRARPRRSAARCAPSSPSTSRPSSRTSSTPPASSHDDAFARALGARHWIAPDWPRDGFEVLDAEGVHVLTDELTRADAPIYAVVDVDDGGPRHPGRRLGRAAGGDPPAGDPGRGRPSPSG